MNGFARTLLLVLLLTQVGSSADLDALINRDLAFRDTILGQHAPAAISRLIKGEATVVTFVPDLPDREGKTHFHIDLDWKYDFKYRTKKTKDAVEVTLSVSNLRVDVDIRHVVRMPKAYYRDDIWQTQLLLHEFDHVAVSGDGRVRMLLDELCGKLPQLRAKLTSGDRPSDAFCRAVINREFARRKDAVIALIGANYVLLDKVSDHGRRVVPDRKQFFTRLYTQRNLEERRFPYLQAVSKLLESDAYRAVKAKNLVKDPTERKDAVAE